jgi:hypothetical protein
MVEFYLNSSIREIRLSRTRLIDIDECHANIS